MLTLTIAFFALARRQGPAITIDLKAPRHPISPLIYGMNDNLGDVDPGLAKDADCSALLSGPQVKSTEHPGPPRAIPPKSQHGAPAAPPSEPQRAEPDSR